MKTALIVGSEGQDGTLLRLLLIEKGYRVFAIGRKKREATNSGGTYDFFQFDLDQDPFEVMADYIVNLVPDEIYYVAAFHKSSQEDSGMDVEAIDSSNRVNYLSFISLLEICKNRSPQTRIVYTSSSLIFAGSENEIQDESTVYTPKCIYSLNKCASMVAAKYYRDTFGLFVSVGIMYNHESMLRGGNFLSQIVIGEIKKYLAGEIDKIVVGDLYAKTDWGYAPDYVQALWHILQLPQPDTFIVSSGKPHQVKDWFEVLFEYLGMDWQKYIFTDKSLLIRKKPTLIGDNTKLVSTGWIPKTSFKEMVIRMYKEII
jgi:GDPmannose 4,6-dehydratase